MLGGAPVTRDVAILFGADGYAENAGNALQEAIRMIAQLRKLGRDKKIRRIKSFFAGAMLRVVMIPSRGKRCHCQEQDEEAIFRSRTSARK
jgi:hypothetical protein